MCSLRIYLPAPYWAMMDTKPTTSLAEAWAAHYRCVYISCVCTYEPEHRESHQSGSIVRLKSHHRLFSLPAAAQFLGAGEVWENGGARFCLGAEPQVPQHLPHEDTGHVNRDACWFGNIDNPCAGRSAAGYIFVVVQQSGEALCHRCFYTHTCWIWTNQRLYVVLFWKSLM